MDKIAAFTTRQELEKDKPVFIEKTPVAGLHLVEQGSVKVFKDTPYGRIDLLQVEQGSFFADDVLLDDDFYETSADSADENTALLTVDRSSLLSLFEQDRDLALHFYWYFWKNLSFQIREANDLLKSFFTPDGSGDEKTAVEDKKRREKQQRTFQMTLNKKEALLKEQGVDSNELKLLAKHSTEELFNRGEYIFREGDPGDRLFIIADGSVLITKKIEGVGEEALAVLRKGEFFGEMALVDGSVRSADAKAHKSGTTVLAVNKEILKEVLNMDVESAYRFMSVLYKILNRRLKEIREKIYQWKLMAGGF